MGDLNCQRSVWHQIGLIEIADRSDEIVICVALGDNDCVTEFMVIRFELVRRPIGFADFGIVDLPL